jgi:hypothetical protein
MMVLVAVVFAVAACGGNGDSNSGRSDDVATTTIRSDEEAGSDIIAIDLFTDEQLATADELATIAVDAFGSPEAATDAVLFALDAGYDGEQIEAAIRAGTLRPGGVIDGVEPAFPPINLVLGFRRASPEPLPVERLRQAATDEAAALDLHVPGGTSGRLGATLILLMVTAGIPPQGIIEALILGFDWEPDVEIGVLCKNQAISVAGTLYYRDYCPDDPTASTVPTAELAEAESADKDAGEAAPVDESGSIENGTYNGATDRDSEMGQFFADLEGIVSTDTAQVVVKDGSVVSFMAELSGMGASHLNLATGERLCENPLKINVASTDPSAVTVSGNTAQVPVTIKITQEVGTGSECLPESNVFFADTFDDIATITFTEDTAVAVLALGFGATMTR